MTTSRMTVPTDKHGVCLVGDVGFAQGLRLGGEIRPELQGFHAAVRSTQRCVLARPPVGILRMFYVPMPSCVLRVFLCALQRSWGPPAAAGQHRWPVAR